MDVPGIGIVEVHYDIRAADGEFVTFETHFRFAEQDISMTTSTLRFMNQEEIARHLHVAGFLNVQWLGNYDGSRFTSASPEIIALAG